MGFQAYCLKNILGGFRLISGLLSRGTGKKKVVATKIILCGDGDVDDIQNKFWKVIVIKLFFTLTVMATKDFSW